MNDLTIIGIHGLLNKPNENTLRDWWRDAMLEGLRRNRGFSGHLPSFELAYWADVRYPEPIPLEELDEPYFVEDGSGPFERYDKKLLIEPREILSKYGGAFVDKAKDLAGLGKSVETLLGVTLEDLAEYYEKDSVRTAIRGKLVAIIEEQKGNDLLLIGHSMGSIVAYDVLRSHDNDDDLRIAHFVTIGSPLGLPYVSFKIREEFGNARTPQCVRRWTNISDPGDKVAIDCNLADDYDPNDNGIRVVDAFIKNTYKSRTGKANNHKSYGYLRAPEIADLLLDFIKR